MKEEQGKQNETAVTTFPVPCALADITENIVNTNNQSKPSKEQIINQAFKFHSQGKISEAQNIINILSIKVSKITEFFLTMVSY